MTFQSLYRPHFEGLAKALSVALKEKDNALEFVLRLNPASGSRSVSVFVQLHKRGTWHVWDRDGWTYKTDMLEDAMREICDYIVSEKKEDLALWG